MSDTSFVPVGRFATSPVHSVTPDESMRRAHMLMLLHDISALPVIDSVGALLGVVSRTDLLRVGRLETNRRYLKALLTLTDEPIMKVMTEGAVTVEPDESLPVACRTMVEHRVHRLYVVRGGVLKGVFSTRDAMRAVYELEVDPPLWELMSSPVLTIAHDAPISKAAELLELASITGLVVLEDDWPVGVFTQIEALHAQTMPRDAHVEDIMGFALIAMPHNVRLNRAAAQAATMDVRRIVAVRNAKVVGILTGLDFVFALSQSGVAA